MLKNIIIVALLACCAWLAVRLLAPERLPSWLGGTETREGPPKTPAREKQMAAIPSKAAAGAKAEKPGTETAAEGAAFGSRVLRKGLRGADVTELQERLRLAGFVHQSFTPGVFEDATEQAVLAYQKGTPFLAEMYHFRGLPEPHKTFVDAALARQLMKVPTPSKALTHYTVAQGDTLFRIAGRFGVGVESIAYLNNMRDSKGLKVGQSLVIICDQTKAR